MKKKICLFCLGTGLWYLVELIFRTIVHHRPPHLITCTIAGAALVLLDALLIKSTKYLFVKGLAVAAFITLFEYIIGYICNVKLQMHLWNYQGMFLNLHGQICFKFTLGWIVISEILIHLYALLKHITQR